MSNIVWSSYFLFSKMTAKYVMDIPFVFHLTQDEAFIDIMTLIWHKKWFDILWHINAWFDKNCPVHTKLLCPAWMPFHNKTQIILLRLFSLLFKHFIIKNAQTDKKQNCMDVTISLILLWIAKSSYLLFVKIIISTFNTDNIDGFSVFGNSSEFLFNLQCNESPDSTQLKQLWLWFHNAVYWNCEYLSYSQYSIVNFTNNKGVWALSGFLPKWWLS